MKTNQTTTLWAEVQSRGIEHANHESDLYLPATDEVREILKRFPEHKPTTFLNQVTGTTWFDIPFAFLPWWEKRAK